MNTLERNRLKHFRGKAEGAMKDVAITKVKFQSESGDCDGDFEAALQELDRIIEYHAKQVAERFGITVEVEQE